MRRFIFGQPIIPIFLLSHGQTSFRPRTKKSLETKSKLKRQQKPKINKRIELLQNNNNNKEEEEEEEEKKKKNNVMKPIENSCNSSSIMLSHENAVNIEKFFLQRLTQNRVEASSTPDITSLLYNSLNENIIDSTHNETFQVKEDVRFHRRLNSRFLSVCDQDKMYGTSEVLFCTIYNDIKMRLRWAREALYILQKYLLQIEEEQKQKKELVQIRNNNNNNNIRKIPNRLVILVLYSHTQHDAAVGHYMKRIHEIVKEMLAERHEEILGLLTTVIGVKWRGLEPNNNNNNNLNQDDILWYPNAGLYTFNAVLQCLSSVGVKTNVKDDLNIPSLQIDRKVLIVSEGWFHIRTAAELHQPVDKKNQNCDSVNVEPLPFILGSSHSDEEILQFARYTACRALS